MSARPMHYVENGETKGPNNDDEGRDQPQAVAPPPYEEPETEDEGIKLYDALAYWLREELAGGSDPYTPEDIEAAKGYMCGTIRDNIAALKDGSMGGKYDDFLFATNFLLAALSFSKEFEANLLRSENANRVNPHRLINHLFVSRILLPKFVGFSEAVSATLPTPDQALD